MHTLGLPLSVATQQVTVNPCPLPPLLPHLSPAPPPQAADTWSPEFSFLGPPNGDPGTTVRVYALADMGAGEVRGTWSGTG